MLIFELLDLLPKKIESAEAKEALLPKIVPDALDQFEPESEEKIRYFREFAGRRLPFVT